MTRTVQEEENEHHANRHLQADPEGEAHKEERVRERTRMYDEQGVGIAAHQEGAANDEGEASDDDDDAVEEDVADDDGADDDTEVDADEDEEEN
jgi:hypothetical protein